MGHTITKVWFYAFLMAALASYTGKLTSGEKPPDMHMIKKNPPLTGTKYE